MKWNRFNGVPNYYTFFIFAIAGMLHDPYIVVHNRISAKSSVSTSSWTSRKAVAQQAPVRRRSIEATSRGRRRAREPSVWRSSRAAGRAGDDRSAADRRASLGRPMTPVSVPGGRSMAAEGRWRWRFQIDGLGRPWRGCVRAASTGPGPVNARPVASLGDREVLWKNRARINAENDCQIISIARTIGLFSDIH